MQDNRLSQYQINPTSNQKAIELTKQDQVLKGEIETLQTNQDRLDAKYDKLGDELRRHPAETESEKSNFEKLRKEYDKTGIEAGDNRKVLEQKEKEYADFKKQNGIGQEVADIDKDKGETYKEHTGRDLDRNVYGYDGVNKPSNLSNPINEEVAKQAKEATTPVNQAEQDSSHTQHSAKTPTNEATHFPSQADKTHENNMGNDGVSGGMNTNGAKDSLSKYSVSQGSSNKAKEQVMDKGPER